MGILRTGTSSVLAEVAGRVSFGVPPQPPPLPQRCERIKMLLGVSKLVGVKGLVTFLLPWHLKPPAPQRWVWHKLDGSGGDNQRQSCSPHGFRWALSLCCQMRQNLALTAPVQESCLIEGEQRCVRTLKSINKPRHMWGNCMCW